ncbi:hypothetical protein ACN38_g10960 [Penicillium nordicum]|uniref:Uncharacterized protein n=1 Tax=Penicillium nordicum TaxID=229535 RepID=A0A0M8NT54_9EURO|nr:hypothetical protein ACN38_g10960 [Penicillium nordicum]
MIQSLFAVKLSSTSSLPILLRDNRGILTLHWPDYPCLIQNKLRNVCPFNGGKQPSDCANSGQIGLSA